MTLMAYFCVYILIVLHISFSYSLHLTGTWRSQDEFYLFLAKFGFQQTTRGLITRQTSGYIYGNITSPNVTSSGLTLVLVDSEYFMEYYGNRSRVPRSIACRDMFNKITETAYDSRCYPRGPQDFLRKVPCPVNNLCVDEDNPSNIIPGYQFTYIVQDLKKPRFWYISFVACHLNSSDIKSCHWDHQTQPFTVNFDIWLVNGHPFTKHINPFEHQFSFEQHDIFEIHVTFLLLCCILIPLWLYAYKKQIHRLTQLFTACIVLETLGILCNFIHTLKFAFDGVGVYYLHIIGDAIDSIAECLFVLLLLVIAKGWAITTKDLDGKIPLFIVWGCYAVVNGALFIWNLTELDIVSNTEEWETWPGYITLAFRMAIMCWFLYELRKTSIKERCLERLQFFQHFGAGYLVWFIYLPILAVICTQVSSLWKRKTTLSITYSADFLAFAVLVHLLWPTRTALNFVERETPLPPDELEVAGLLDSEPTFREIIHEHPSSPKPHINKTNGEVKLKPAIKIKPMKKEDKSVLLDYDDFSDYDSL